MNGCVEGGQPKPPSRSFTIGKLVEQILYNFTHYTHMDTALSFGELLNNQASSFITVFFVLFHVVRTQWTSSSHHHSLKDNDDNNNNNNNNYPMLQRNDGDAQKK